MSFEQPERPFDVPRSAVPYSEYIESRYEVSCINRHYKYALQNEQDFGEDGQRAYVYFGQFYILIDQLPQLDTEEPLTVYTTIVGCEDFYSTNLDAAERWLWERWVNDEVNCG